MKISILKMNTTLANQLNEVQTYRRCLIVISGGEAVFWRIIPYLTLTWELLTRWILSKNIMYSWVTSSRKIPILFTKACHLDRRDRSDKVLLSCKIPHIHLGWHEKIRDCRIMYIVNSFYNLHKYKLHTMKLRLHFFQGTLLVCSVENRHLLHLNCTNSETLKYWGKADFDNFMMIAYIWRVNFVGKKFFTSSANSLTL